MFTHSLTVVRIEIESLASLGYDVDGHEPEQWPTLTLSRHRDGFAMYETDPWEDRSVLKEQCSPDQFFDLCSTPEQRAQVSRVPAMDARDAWDWFAQMSYTETVLLLVGPGDSPVKLETPIFFPSHWRVWEVDSSGIVRHVGDFLHRLSVMHAVKSIIEAGLCPIAATHYLGSGSEWDEDVVVRSSEIAAETGSSLR